MMYNDTETASNIITQIKYKILLKLLKLLKSNTQ